MIRLARPVGGRTTATSPHHGGCAVFALGVWLGLGCQAPADRPPGSDGGARTTTIVEPGGAGAGGAGAGGGTATGSRADLGWPFDDEVPEPCPPNPPDPTGPAWTGWANVQHPPVAAVAGGQLSESLYGRVYRTGETSLSGPAPGWEAEIGTGPYGSLPTGDGRCWHHQPASFNVDVGNDDEYAAAVTPTRPGLVGFLFRYRPPGGVWRYGDLDGSDNGLSAAAAGLIVATGPTAPEPLVVATLNLRCRLDDWASRRPLVVRALSRVDPDLVALQEDCAVDGGPSQAEEIGARLSTFTGRGYQFERASTHVANAEGQSFDEGIAVLSAHPVTDRRALSLPYLHIPRQALAIDVTIRSRPLRFYATHFDYGADAEAVRADAARIIVANLPADRPVLLGGDLNATPGGEAVLKLTTALDDLWAAANPSDPGRTMPVAAPSRRIDYLLGTATMAQNLQGAVLLAEREGATWLSDHRGVAVATMFP